MRLFLIRHGETKWNVERRIQGINDIPMNETGIRQIQALSTRLKQERWDSLYTSPLIRARETADILKRAFNLPAATVVNALQERDFGVLNGVVWEFAREGELPDDAQGMEPSVHAAMRMQGVLEEVKRKHAGENVILVSHGSMLFCWYHWMEAQSKIAPLPESYVFRNACILPVCFEEETGWFWDERYLHEAQ